MGYVLEIGVEKICASGPLTKVFEVAPRIAPAEPIVSRLADVVFKTPVLKVRLPFTVQGALNVTPAASLTVRLLTAEGSPSVTCAVLPLKTKFAAALSVGAVT